MAFNDEIKGNNRGFSPNDMQTEAQLYAKLNNLKRNFNRELEKEQLRLDRERELKALESYKHLILEEKRLEADLADFKSVLDGDEDKHKRLLQEKRVQEQQKETQLYNTLVTKYIDKEYKLQKEKTDKLAQYKGKDLKGYQKKLDEDIAKRLKKEKKQIDDILKYKQNKEKVDEKKQSRAEDQALMDERRSAGNLAFDGSASLLKRAQALNDLRQEQGFGAVMDALIGGLGDFVRKLDSTIDNIAGYQSKIDTRLMGSGKYWESRDGLFDQNSIANIINGVIAASPFIKQQKMTENLASLVDKGIAYNVEQRAFLQTISEKIATTFDAANGTLLQLIRVQQKDTTAARLGMETTLTQFLNGMFQTTEYLSGLSDTVSSSIYEAVAQVGGERGVGLEYQIQKWLGSLYSVGMSQNAIQNLANALGMLGSGNVTGLASNSAMQNLFVMASSQAGYNYADLLTQGLNESDVNTLMESVVKYLASIANSNKVVQSQFASVFGMTMSDMLSIKNLVSNQEAFNNIVNSNLSYNNAVENLFEAASTIGERTSTGELLQNAFENIKYSLSASIASNPALYGIWKASNMLSDLVGGIAIPTISVMGNMVDLNTTVADIMRVGALSGGILSSIGNIVAAGSSGGFDNQAMLTALGIQMSSTEADRLAFYNELSEDQLAALMGKTIQRQQMVKAKRGGNRNLDGSVKSGASVSESSLMVGNTSASDIYESSMASAEAQKEELTVKDPDQVELKDVNSNIVNIYNLFKDIVDSTKGLRTYVYMDTIDGLSKSFGLPE